MIPFIKNLSRKGRVIHRKQSSELSVGGTCLHSKHLGGLGKIITLAYSEFEASLVYMSYGYTLISSTTHTPSAGVTWE